MLEIIKEMSWGECVEDVKIPTTTKIEKTSCNISFRTQFIEIEMYKEIGKTSAVSRATDRQYLFYNEKDISLYL